MPLVLVMGSHVAGSRVGGTVVSLALALSPWKIDPVHVPTTLLGRHPGWGPPGGAAVAAGTMAAMLDAIEAQGLFALMDGVITDYFAGPDQIAVAADAIARIRAVRPGVRVLVDPVMGDLPGGLYVPPAVADTLMETLLPLADIATPNLWELQRLSGSGCGDAAAIRDAAAALGVAEVVVTSAPAGAGRIGLVGVWPGGAGLASHPARVDVPKGTGDLLAAALLAYRVGGHGPRAALAGAGAVVADVVDRAMAWRAPELPVVAARYSWSAQPLEVLDL